MGVMSEDEIGCAETEMVRADGADYPVQNMVSQTDALGFTRPTSISDSKMIIPHLPQAMKAIGLDWQIYLGDAGVLIKGVPDSSIDIIVTDPPYFIDGMGDDWDDMTLQAKAAKAKTIGGLPVGMKFDPRQGRLFEEFMRKFAIEFYRVLKPGAFCISFSQARLYHRLAVALEESGFGIRDMMGWVHNGQAKAFSQDHFVRKMKDLTLEQQDEIIKRLGGRKTPQLRPCIDPMVLAQKPKEGTFVANWLKYRTGLIDTSVTIDGKFPGNLMEFAKATRVEKGAGNEHLTIKPVMLIEHLLKIFSTEEQTVLDPFMGSGSHGVAAIKVNRRFIGFEISEKYFETAQKRLIARSER